MYSKTIIAGNLGTDPEMRSTQNGVNVANFSVAVSRGWGENKKTEWYNVVAWKTLAETAEKYLKKGSKVLVEGEMETRSWDKDDGTKGYSTELIANRIQFLESRADSEQNNNVGDSADSDVPF